MLNLGLKIVPHCLTMFSRPAPIRLPEVYIAKKRELWEKVIWTVVATMILGDPPRSVAQKL